MTAQELIDKLEQYDPKREVLVRSDFGGNPILWEIESLEGVGNPIIQL